MKTHVLCSTAFPENCTVYETIPKKICWIPRGHMTSQYGSYALHVRLAWLHALMCMHTPTRSNTHIHARTHRPLSNTYCFTTPTVVMRTHLNITLYINCSSCFFYPRDLLEKLLLLLSWLSRCTSHSLSITQL